MTQADRRRAEILQAAVACFRRSGFHQTSMQEICTAVGMSPGSLYRYFASKDDMILALVEAERGRTLAFFAELEVAGDIIPALLDLADRFYWQQVDLGLFALTADIASECRVNPKIFEACERIEADAGARLAAVLQRGQRSGQIDPELDVPSTVQILLALHDGASIRQIFSNTPAGALAKATLRRLVVRFLRPAVLHPVANDHSQPLHGGQP